MSLSLRRWGPNVWALYEDDGNSFGGRLLEVVDGEAAETLARQAEHVASRSIRTVRPGDNGGALAGSAASTQALTGELDQLSAVTEEVHL